jgi:hypothetical protein
MIAGGLHEEAIRAAQRDLMVERQVHHIAATLNRVPGFVRRDGKCWCGRERVAHPLHDLFSPSQGVATRPRRVPATACRPGKSEGKQ